MTIMLLTLPHDDFGAAAEVPFVAFALASASNSSANPHEQSLQALRLPVVPHTEQINNISAS